MNRKTHNDFLGEVEVAKSIPAQIGKYISENVGTKSDLNSIAKRDAAQGRGE